MGFNEEGYTISSLEEETEDGENDGEKEGDELLLNDHRMDLSMYGMTSLFEQHAFASPHLMYTSIYLTSPYSPPEYC